MAQVDFEVYVTLRCCYANASINNMRFGKKKKVKNSLTLFAKLVENNIIQESFSK